MNVYFDTEFTGLTKDAELISIGLISAMGDIFYAEITDYDITKCSDWVKENVISQLFLNSADCKTNVVELLADNFKDYSHILNNTIVQICDTKDNVKEALLLWFKTIGGGEIINFVSDVCHYDMVLLIDLIADNALNVPDFISPCCYDINQDIASYNSIEMNEAFDINREEYSDNLLGITSTDNTEDENLKHNSLWDAYIIKIIYECSNPVC